MIRTSTLGAVALLVAAPFAGSAQNAREDDVGSSIGLVSVTRAVEESPRYRAAGEEWTAVMNRRSGELRRKQDELIATQDRITAAQAGATEAEREAMMAEIEQIQNDLARMNQDLQRDLNALRSELLRPVVEEVGAAIRAYAAENDLTLVIDISHPEIAPVFVDEAADITDAVVARLREGQEP
jgi:Skp family chaperone for outer membrane proteins